VIEPEDLDLPSPEAEEEDEGIGSLKEMERRHVLKVLIEFEWNITRAAHALGIDRVTLYHKIKKYGLSRDEDR
jgi:two-component system response regulator HydG